MLEFFHFQKPPIFSWSYAVLLYEIFSLGNVPYANMEELQILPFLEHGQRLEKTTHCTVEM